MLIVGGTGYLGQHILQDLCGASTPYDVAFTHHSTPPPPPLLAAISPSSLVFQVDLRTGHGFQAISEALGQPDVVINCAALSVPRTCEMDPTSAMSINVPSTLVKWLSSFKGKETLLVHLSTDQVYEGIKSFYKEEDETIPVNTYGKSKVAAEQFVATHCSNYAILRSSIIFGPQTISPVPKSLPIQWIDSVLSKGEVQDFFHDEYRCPIFVKDLVTIISTLINKWTSGYAEVRNQMQLVLNAGGPDRVSRVQMAEAVTDVRGYNTSLIRSVSASSVDRGVKSPADISMDTSKLVHTLGISLTPFRIGVKLTLEAEAASL